MLLIMQGMSAAYLVKLMEFRRHNLGRSRLIYFFNDFFHIMLHTDWIFFLVPFYLFDGTQ